MRHHACRARHWHWPDACFLAVRPVRATGFKFLLVCFQSPTDHRRRFRNPSLHIKIERPKAPVTPSRVGPRHVASWEVAVCRDSVEEISVRLLLCRIHVGLTILLSASDRENFKRFKILAASRVDLATNSNSLEQLSWPLSHNVGCCLHFSACTNNC